MEEILKAISTVGFPIAVAAFVLIRIEPKLTKLIEAITTLIPIVSASSDNVKHVEDALVDFRVEVSKINGRAK